MLHALLAISTLLGAKEAPPPAPTPEAPSFVSFADAFARPKQKPLSPGEIAAQLRSEKFPYKQLELPLSELKDVPENKLADVLWPRQREQLAFPTVLSGDDKVSSLPMPDAAALKIEEGETLFRQEKYEEAAEQYRAALASCPECYPAWIQLGEVARATHRPAEAIRSFDSAIELNPLDYRPYFYKGLVLFQGDKPTEATNPWKTALALYPRNLTLLDLMKRNEGKLKVRMLGDVMQPRAYARLKDGRLEIYADLTRGNHWLAYGRCKALWLGSEQHRQDVTGVLEHKFTAAEELECLNALVATYEHRRANETGFSEDPTVERIAQLLKERSGSELVLYELAARVNPHVTLLLSKGERRTLEKFISKYVVAARR